MSWQKSIVLNEGEHVLHSWDGNCERQHKAVVKAFIGHKTVQAKEIHRGTLVLTNQRMLWFERRGFLSKVMRSSFDIDLLSLQGIAIGGKISTWISITDKESEYIFHLGNVGKKEAEPFRDMIYRQIENLKQPRKGDRTIREKETITKEVVMIPCKYCGALMPQTSLFCNNCGAKKT